jgi:hypothetical protein
MFILRFFPTGSLGFWLGVSTDVGGRFFILHVFQQLLVSKMSNDGASSGDPKGKSELISRDEKRRRELEARGHRFLGASGCTNDGNRPSKECKAAVVQALYE